MTWRVGLCGWFGYGNVGDDLLLSLIAARIHPEAVFSTRPGVVEGLQVRDVAELDEWAEHLDLLLIGGGGLLNNRWLARLGLDRYRGEYGFLSVGIPNTAWLDGLGPILARARFVTVRDHLALRTLEVAYPSLDAFWLPDPAFMLVPRSVARRPLLLLNPRTLTPRLMRADAPEDPDARQVALMSALIEACGTSHEVLAIGFEERDRVLLTQLPCANEIVGWSRAVDLIASARGLLTARLHGGIVAAVHGTPVILIDHDDKLRGLAELLDEPAYGWTCLDDVTDAVIGMLTSPPSETTGAVTAYAGLVRRVLDFMTA